MIAQQALWPQHHATLNPKTLTLNSEHGLVIVHWYD
jgi:hypothetical protein